MVRKPIFRNPPIRFHLGFSLGVTLAAWHGMGRSLVAVLLLAACGTGPNGMSPESLAEGRSVYQANCAVCHGPNGEGQMDWHIRKADGTLPPPPLNGDGHTWHHGDGTIFRTVSQGGAIYESPALPGFQSGMPAFGDTLSHGEIVLVINYLKSTWGRQDVPGGGEEGVPGDGQRKGPVSGRGTIGPRPPWASGITKTPALHSRRRCPWEGVWGFEDGPRPSSGTVKRISG